MVGQNRAPRERWRKWCPCARSDVDRQSHPRISKRNTHIEWNPRLRCAGRRWECGGEIRGGISCDRRKTFIAWLNGSQARRPHKQEPRYQDERLEEGAHSTFVPSRPVEHSDHFPTPPHAAAPFPPASGGANRGFQKRAAPCTPSIARGRIGAVPPRSAVGRPRSDGVMTARSRQSVALTRTGDHHAIANQWMAGQHLLDFQRVHLPAGDVDQQLDPAGDEQARQWHRAAQDRR